jgi:hypothetical protein
MRPTALLAALGVLAAAGRAGAQPCDPAAATRRRAVIEAQLAADARPSRIWNTGWAIGLGVSAAGNGILAIEPDWAPIDVDRGLRAGLATTAIKSTIGAAGRVVLPLNVGRVAPPTGDACADVAAAEAALAWTAGKQKRTFWLNLVGATALHIGSTLVVGIGYDDWTTAVIGLGTSMIVTAAIAWTQPRGAWKLHKLGTPRESSSWLLVPDVAPGRAGVVLTLSL